MTDDNISQDALRASIQSMERSGDDLELVVRLSNTARRALHYISDVRTKRYDPATRTLTLSLSDEGREVIPGAAAQLPQFRVIDPESQAEIRVRVPRRVVKFSRTAPPGQLAFETQQLSDMDIVVVNIAWAETPFYEDTRITDTDDMRLPGARWEQHRAQVTQRLRGS